MSENISLPVSIAVLMMKTSSRRKTIFRNSLSKIRWRWSTKASRKF